MSSHLKNICLIGVDLGGTKVETGLVNDLKVSESNYNLITSKSEDPQVITEEIIKTFPYKNW